MNEKIYSETYKGMDIEIYQDWNSDSPQDWGDEEVFLVAFHRDFTVGVEGFSQEVCQLINEKPSDIYDESLRERVKQIKREYHVFGLEAYIHSGVSLSLSHEGNYPDRQWDVSQLGLVFVSKEHCRLHKTARARALGLIETWNDNLSGNVYGYSVGDDSCWGFYGDYEKEGGALQAAREAADYQAAENKKAYEARKKIEITKRVPLEKRTALVTV